MRVRKPLLVAVAAVAATGLLAGCGSSSDSSASGRDSATSPIKILSMAPFQSSVLSLGDAEASTKAAVAALNAAGGLNGHPLEVVYCNDKMDPNTAAGCARQAVSEKVVAVTSAYEPNSPSVLPVLQAAHIPFVYSSVAADIDGTSNVSFPRDAGVPAQYASLGVELVKKGCTKVGAIVLTLPATETGAKWLKTAVMASGAQWAGEVEAPQDQADYSAPVQTLLSKGMDCLVPVEAPDSGAKVIIAARQASSTLQIGADSSLLSDAAIKTLGSASDGIILTGQEYRTGDTGVPAVATVLAGVKKYQPSAPALSKFALTAWADVTALQQVLKGVDGSYTAASVATSAAATQVETGLLAPISWGSSTETPYAGYPRVHNWSYLAWEVKGGKPALLYPDFQQMPAAVLK
ncbi:ABC transporter substrate-binding protein [Nocardioides sp. Iso805N]|uniref:ABC transporter substrate-binding protein n=1 Tax=Nocardioides sp. Iso805N TaxID=1283287 RepID=UPI0012FC6DF0|nr:ABC transporter substrate-binding protein [Nocardioides sp. Iso805N]